MNVIIKCYRIVQDNELQPKTDKAMVRKDILF